MFLMRAYSMISFSGMVLRGSVRGMRPGCILVCGPSRASFCISLLMKFIRIDCVVSSRLWPVMSLVISSCFDKVLRQNLRNTPQ